MQENPGEMQGAENGMIRVDLKRFRDVMRHELTGSVSSDKMGVWKRCSL
jgi:hypothetical protein